MNLNIKNLIFFQCQAEQQQHQAKPNLIDWKLFLTSHVFFSLGFYNQKVQPVNLDHRQYGAWFLPPTQWNSRFKDQSSPVALEAGKNFQNSSCCIFWPALHLVSWSKSYLSSYMPHFEAKNRKKGKAKRRKHMKISTQKQCLGAFTQMLV